MSQHETSTYSVKESIPTSTPQPGVLVAFPLEGGETKDFCVIRKSIILGREVGCDLLFRDDTMSRQHCKIAKRRGHLVAEDLKSKNGTFLNGVKIEKREELCDGDIVRVGNSIVVFHEDIRGVEVVDGGWLYGITGVKEEHSRQKGNVTDIVRTLRERKIKCSKRSIARILDELRLPRLKKPRRQR